MKRNLARIVTIDRSRKSFGETKPVDVATAIVNACAEAKGKDIVVLDVAEIFDLSNYFIVVSGRSDRQVQGISQRILDAVKAFGIDATSIEGLEEGQWVLLDFGDVVVHVFYEPKREHYDVEGLWLRARPLKVEKGSKEGQLVLHAA